MECNQQPSGKSPHLCVAAGRSWVQLPTLHVAIFPSLKPWDPHVRGRIRKKGRGRAGIRSLDRGHASYEPCHRAYYCVVSLRLSMLFNPSKFKFKRNFFVSNWPIDFPLLNPESYQKKKTLWPYPNMPSLYQVVLSTWVNL